MVDVRDILEDAKTIWMENWVCGKMDRKKEGIWSITPLYSPRSASKQGTLSCFRHAASCLSLKICSAKSRATNIHTTRLGAAPLLHHIPPPRPLQLLAPRKTHTCEIAPPVRAVYCLISPNARSIQGRRPTPAPPPKVVIIGCRGLLKPMSGFHPTFDVRATRPQVVGDESEAIPLGRGRQSA
jgi:hypothetical protein